MVTRWSAFRNKPILLDHGPINLRKDAIDILEYYIQAADPYPRTLDMFRKGENELFIKDLKYYLDDLHHIYIVGAGKATQSVALAVEEVLENKITEGLVILKRGESHHLQKIKIVEAAHPIPDQASWDGAKDIVRISEQASRGDLVIALFTGGSSSLMIWPCNGISLQDKQLLNNLLLGCGASIQEINAVRKHVSQVKGGRLGLRIFPAKLINLTVSDVIGDALDCITDLTVPDSSTYKDAWNALDKYNLWKAIPQSISEHLKRGAEIETPKTYTYPYHSFVTVTSKEACQLSAEFCRKLGYETHILTNSMEGESHIAARNFIKSAYEIINQSSNKTRFAFLSSGETTVKLEKVDGEGGRNQEFALSAAYEIAGKKGVIVASVATDGTDGPTDACGGLVDAETISRAKLAGLDPIDALAFHSSKNILNTTGDLLVSGPTGTNVNDIALLLFTNQT